MPSYRRPKSGGIVIMYPWTVGEVDSPGNVVNLRLPFNKNPVFFSADDDGTSRAGEWVSYVERLRIPCGHIRSIRRYENDDDLDQRYPIFVSQIRIFQSPASSRKSGQAGFA